MAKTETKITTKKATAGSTDVSAMRDKNLKELAIELIDVKKDLANAKRSLAAGELVNPRVIGGFRKQIARLNTIIVEKARQDERKEDA